MILDETIEQLANRKLVGRKIVNIRYMTSEEAKGYGYEKRPLVIFLDNGEGIWAQKDDEGNDAGALMTTWKEMMFGTLDSEDA